MCVPKNVEISVGKPCDHLPSLEEELLKVLLIGKGGREHALAWKISQSPILSKLYLWPGNPVMAMIGQKVDLPDTASFNNLAKWAKIENIDLVVSGPEAPLSEGLADVMAEYGIPVFGPHKSGAMLEASKAFAKEVMQAAGIPTAASHLVVDESQCRSVALTMLKESGGTVLKASGLAAGKGVFVCQSERDIEMGLQHLYHSEMKLAAEKVVIEEVLLGRECSYFAFLGRDRSQGLGFAVDYKRLADGDQGPNTGGMGSYTPVQWLPPNAQQLVEDLVVTPLLRELAKRDICYTGCLYVGIMWHPKKGPQVVEFNVRLGDPEAQILAVYDDRDWLALMANCAGVSVSDQGSGRGVDRSLSSVSPSKKVVGVVLTASTYPFGHGVGHAGTIPPHIFANEQSDCFTFAASVGGNLQDGISSSTGRVLTVVAKAENFEKARKIAYDGVDRVRATWPGCHFRTDIGLSAESPLL